MMRGSRIWLGSLLVSLIIGTVLFAGGQGATPSPIGNNVLAQQLALELRQKDAPFPKLQHVSSGVLYTLLEATGELNRRARAVPGFSAPPAGIDTAGCSRQLASGHKRNVRVNQDCSLRRQAEEVIVVNPRDLRNMVAGQNDSRVGFNHCGYDFSLDGGLHWGDLIPPFFTFQFDPLDSLSDTADACSDPTATFDSKGNAYIGGILFNIDSASSAIIVARSDAELKGTFFHEPDPADPFHRFDVPRCIGTDCSGIVQTDFDNPDVFNDKEFMVADANPGSPKADNVYMTWTRFRFTGIGVGADSPIFFSQSSDGGKTWSPGIEISGSNQEFCTIFSGESDPNACDQDQGSHPIVGKDGTVYVAFGNGNTPKPGINQHLIVKCPASADCTKPGSWLGPRKISDDFGTQPVASVTDPVTGCPGGRQCLPPNGYRLDDFVEGSVSIDRNDNLFFAWADYRNGDSPNCPALGNYATSTPPCNNDVFYAFSTDQGATWSAPRIVTPAAKFGQTAQWQPWSSVGPGGTNLWIAYYDRSYGNCEFSGCNDITVAEITDPLEAVPSVEYTRGTSSSMPNLVVANNPLEAGFLGDYMWVTVDSEGHPYVVWADTRGRHGTVEEDIYFRP